MAALTSPRAEFCQNSRAEEEYGAGLSAGGGGGMRRDGRRRSVPGVDGRASRIERSCAERDLTRLGDSNGRIGVVGLIFVLLVLRNRMGWSSARGGVADM